jgi:hypothetical protein
MCAETGFDAKPLWEYLPQQTQLLRQDPGHHRADGWAGA